eukprot:Plantae.Rhodophyta-Purpureofilum_apyrenoidigerum.ctg27664.p1 GENE.Plantae.Rhodophyta-Purpureofilum_apyrenoidigerum.ctg27664~~Plantae.Rhodophyta-Purpureofilum_apyrenoidigerum.ctg27664.p1  ORF type:complete len:342 (+),score=105.90 Plantae.Rhodophyta-Purpureofilum_apyrenoidigerum.ctg27664:36-1061(+)
MPMQLRERKRPVEPPAIKKKAAPKKKKGNEKEVKVESEKAADKVEDGVTAEAKDVEMKEVAAGVDDKGEKETAAAEKAEEAEDGPAEEEKRDESLKAQASETKEAELPDSTAGADEKAAAAAAETKPVETLEKDREAAANEEPPAETAEETKDADDKAAEPAPADKPSEEKPGSAEDSKSEEKSAEAADTDKAGDFAVGQPFPDVTLQGQDDADVNLSTIAKDCGFVLFVYPKASTPGCTKQACGFRDNHEKIVAAGYKVFGVSPDKPKPLLTFKTKQSLPYTLLADPNMTLLKQMGVAKGTKSATRSHIIVSKGGIIADIKIGVSPGDSVTSAVEFITKK